jgi:hypothetical protein
MNLNFTEIDDLGNNDNFEVNGYQTNNYWETSNVNVNVKDQKKKKINYNDILNSLNLVVNKSGVLQYISTTDSAQQEQYSHNQPQQPKGKPLEPQVKNSQIYNKYFKDYKDPNAEYIEEVKVPQTVQEYNRMILEDRIKRIQERNRIAKIKSTKLMFESNNTQVNNGNIRVSKNNLRMMNFN